MQIPKAIGDFEAFAGRVETLRARRGFSPRADAVRRLADEMCNDFAARLPVAKYEGFYDMKPGERVNYALANGMDRRVFFERLLTRVPTVSWRERHERLDKFVLPYLPPKPEISFLEFGCGTFDLRGMAPPATASTVKFLSGRGIAVSATAADWEVPPKFHSRMIGGVSIARSDILSPEFEPLGLFDFIRCTNMLHYYSHEKTATALDRLKSMLAAGGILLEDSGSGEKTIFSVHGKGKDGKVGLLYEGNPYDSPG
jgi:SAM-dependent methyltransferase